MHVAPDLQTARLRIRDWLFATGQPGAEVREANGAAVRNRTQSDAGIAAAILFLTAVVYARVVKFQFVFDDRALIVENPVLRSWRFLPYYFTHHLTSHMFPPMPSSYYRPVLLLWLRINYTLFDLRPAGWHLSTLGLHLTATLTVYLLARQILRDRFTSGVAALFFGLHPVHVECVAWVMGLTEPLVASLSIGSFLCYLKGREGKPGARIGSASSLLLYALGMLAKETALMLPLIIFVYESAFSRRSETVSSKARSASLRAGIRTALPYLILTAPYMAARTMVLKALSHPATFLPRRTLLLTDPLVLWDYLKLLVWPFGLSAFYDVPYVTAPNLRNFFLPVVGLGVAGSALGWWSRRSRDAAFATAWLVFPILPVLNLAVFPEGEIVHDRYLYVPSVGLALLVAIGVGRLRDIPLKPLRQIPLRLVLTVALLVAFGVASIYQCLYWSDNLTLYSRGVAIAPHNNMTKNNLANEYIERGRASEAIALYEEVLAEKPDYWLSSYNLAYAYYKLGRFPEAERYFRRAIEITPLDPDQFLYLGLTWMKMGRFESAAEPIRHAISIRPDAPGYHFALGVALKSQGDLRGALEAFKHELRINPQQQAARKQIAEVEAGLRK